VVTFNTIGTLNYTDVDKNILSQVWIP
jgi:hypothetical protein